MTKEINYMNIAESMAAIAKETVDGMMAHYPSQDFRRAQAETIKGFGKFLILCADDFADLTIPTLYEGFSMVVRADIEARDDAEKEELIKRN